MAEEITLPGGEDQGKPLSECSEKNLRYWAESARRPEIAQACAAELERRAREGNAQPSGQAPATPPNQPKKGNAKPAPQTSIVKRPVFEIAGSTRDIAALNNRLIQAQQEAHL